MRLPCFGTHRHARGQGRQACATEPCPAQLSLSLPSARPMVPIAPRPAAQPGAPLFVPRCTGQASSVPPGHAWATRARLRLMAAPERHCGRREVPVRCPPRRWPRAGASTTWLLKTGTRAPPPAAARAWSGTKQALSALLGSLRFGRFGTVMVREPCDAPRPGIQTKV
jgi:hypothetical protein